MSEKIEGTLLKKKIKADLLTLTRQLQASTKLMRNGTREQLAIQAAANEELLKKLNLDG